MSLFQLFQWCIPERYKYQQIRQQQLAVLEASVAASNLSESTPINGIRAYLSTPLPELTTPLFDLPLVALDFETTGLDANKDKLLSVGAAHLQGKQVLLGQRYHKIIDVAQRLSRSNVCIHQITEQDSQQGESLAVVVDELLSLIAGKALLVHFNKIERNFLRQACWQLYGVKPHFVMIDTLQMASNSLRKKGFIIEPNDLTLANLRRRFYLPSYSAHNALGDAIATAELYLAMMSQRDLSSLRLKDVIV